MISLTNLPGSLNGKKDTSGFLTNPGRLVSINIIIFVAEKSFLDAYLCLFYNSLFKTSH